MALALKKIPDLPAERIEYHNELMKLCGVSLRELTAAMKAGAEKKQKKEELKKGEQKKDDQKPEEGVHRVHRKRQRSRTRSR